jgi:hypothetical protein
MMKSSGEKPIPCAVPLLIAFHPFCLLSVLVQVRFRLYMRVYPKVSGLAAGSEKCKWYSFLPLGAVVSLFCEPV